MIKNALRIVVLHDDRRLCSLRVGQSLSDARAINPDIETLQHEPNSDLELLKDIACWCERYTPLVSLSGDTGLFLDITGCAHLFDGEEALRNDLASRLQAQGFGVKISIADTAGAAWAFAQYSQQHIIPKNAHRELLHDLPLKALRLSDDKVRELSRVGFKTIGCLVGLPRAPIVARFGELVLQRLDQAFGDQDEVLSPLQPIAELVREKRFPEPIVYEDDIKATIKHVAKELSLDLETKGLGVRQCRLQLFRADGKVTSLYVDASNPIRDTKRIASLFDERLASLHDDWDIGFGFDVVQLSALHCDLLQERQQDLAAKAQSEEVFSHLIDRLSVRLGSEAVQVYQMVDTHIPERKCQLAPALHGLSELEPAEPSTRATRPIMLFHHPELANVMAEIPEGPPIHFRWRKAYYQVEQFEGPERIACEWWKDGRAARTRDYFRVETKEGLRLWLFRHGLYERETNHPKWYIHGMFA